jgi:predicted transcriptional regulator
MDTKNFNNCEEVTDLHIRVLKLLTSTEASNLWAKFLEAKLGINVEESEKVIDDLVEEGSNRLLDSHGRKVSDWHLTKEGEELIEAYEDRQQEQRRRREEEML